VKIIVPTCNSYADLMPGFAKRCNECWPKQDVTVLHYEDKPDVPDNFKCVSLGAQPQGKDWTSGIIPYFSSLKDDYFILLLDDYYLDRAVNVSLVRQVESFVEVFRPDKFDLTTDRMNFPHVYTQWPFIVESRPEARYRTSLQAAIWKTEYFRKYLVAGRSPWAFEIEGEKDAMYDGGVIFGSCMGVVRYTNVMLKGKKI